MNISKVVVTSCMLLIFVSGAMSQITFSVSPGIQLYGGSFGYKMNRAVPFIGLNAVSGSMSILETGYENDDNDGSIVSFSNNYKIVGSAFVPTVGLKYFLKETDKVKTYGLLSATTVIFSAEVKESEDMEDNEDLQDAIGELRIFGGQLGFGAEYFFDPMFSIGGEFGLRMLFLKNEVTHYDEVFNPDTGDFESKPHTTEYKFNLNPTYAKISLNYYFKGKDGGEK